MAVAEAALASALSAFIGDTSSDTSPVGAARDLVRELGLCAFRAAPMSLQSGRPLASREAPWIADEIERVTLEATDMREDVHSIVREVLRRFDGGFSRWGARKFYDILKAP